MDAASVRVLCVWMCRVDSAVIYSFVYLFMYLVLHLIHLFIYISNYVYNVYIYFSFILLLFSSSFFFCFLGVLKFTVSCGFAMLLFSVI